MTGMRATIRLGVLLVLVGCMGGCSEQPAELEHDPVSTEPLPEPERAGASVTGMPAQPGPGPVGSPPRPDEGAAGTTIDTGNPVDGDGVAPLVVLPEPLSRPAPTAEGPGPDEAVKVVRDYYEAINAGAFDQAYGLWSNQGQASGQSPEQFADAFDNTAGITVEVMPPGRIEPAAGSRYIEVPVAFSTTHRDGSTRHYVGAYNLRRAVVDGASPEQRAWRLDSADIREVRP